MSIDFDREYLSTASREDLTSTILSFVDRFRVLESLILQMQAENAVLRTDNMALVERVKELEDRLSKDSHNSSKPPSSDGLAKKPSPKSQREKGKRSSGGQPGHPGKTLRMSENPKHVVPHTPSICTDCGISLADVAPLDDYDRRQVFDLPPMVIEVTEHRSLRKACPDCGRVHQGEFPANVSQQVQYGETIKGLAVYLTNYQLLPLKRTSALLKDLFNCSLSQSVLQSAQQNCAQVLAPITEWIKEALKNADLVHFDETG